MAKLQLHPSGMESLARCGVAEPECTCRFTGDIADASDCDLHGLHASWNDYALPAPGPEQEGLTSEECPF